MKDALMLAAQITPEERAISKEIARQKGMTYAGWLGFLIKREIRNYSDKVTTVNDHAGDIGRAYEN